MKYTRAAGAILAVGAALVPAATASGETALKSADAPVGQLEKASTHTPTAGSSVTHYDQVVGGVPVSGADVVVSDLAGSAPEVLFDKSVSGLEAPDAPSVPRAQALAVALAAIGSPSGGHRSAELVIDATRGNQLAWQVSYYDSRPISDWLVTVSAASGDVIGKDDQLLRAEGSANLFDPNPVVSENGYEGLRDRQDRDSANLTDARIPVTLEDIKDGQDCLKGDWATATFNPTAKKVCKASLNWDNTKRESNRFEALMAYHHVTESQRYIQTLDLDPINEERQNLIANSFSADNSFYSGGADEIQLGTGGVDDGEDADVIIHEYGHAVQDAQNPSAHSGNQGGAMGEGFGDYLAAAYSTEMSGFDNEWTPCIMEWDATSYDDNSSDPPGICLRRGDDPDSRPDQIDECEGGSANIHCIGQVWSSALLDLRALLGDDGSGRSIVDRILLDSHFALPSNATFEEAAEAVVTSDTALYAGAHCGQLADEFNDREFGTFAC